MEWKTEMNDYVNFCEMFKVFGYLMLFYNKKNIINWSIRATSEIGIYVLSVVTTVDRAEFDIELNEK